MFPKISFIKSVSKITLAGLAAITLMSPPTNLAHRSMLPVNKENSISSSLQLSPRFDICLKDDFTNDRLRINSVTGEYEYRIGSQGRIIIPNLTSPLLDVRKGNVSTTGCTLTLNDPLRVVAKVNQCLGTVNVNNGSATISLGLFSPPINIFDSNTLNNNCSSSPDVLNAENRCTQQYNKDKRACSRSTMSTSAYRTCIGNALDKAVICDARSDPRF